MILLPTTTTWGTIDTPDTADLTITIIDTIDTPDITGTAGHITTIQDTAGLTITI